VKLQDNVLLLCAGLQSVDCHIQVAAAPQAVCQHQTACSAAEFKSMATRLMYCVRLAHDRKVIFTHRVESLRRPARAHAGAAAFAPLPDIGLTSATYLQGITSSGRRCVRIDVSFEAFTHAGTRRGKTYATLVTMSRNCWGKLQSCIERFTVVALAMHH
jgi:hypothetical protein